MTTQTQKLDSNLPTAARAPAANTLVEAGAAFLRFAGLDGVAEPPSAAEASGARSLAGQTPERFEVIVIGGGQAGLSVGYHLRQRGVRFVILDASERVGDAWRKRWDSLRLFSPAWASSLDGLPFPGPRNALPTKDEMADYLEGYAAHFELPVRTQTRVESLTRGATGFVVRTDRATLEADQVIIAMASYQKARTPAFARDLRPDIVQLHSSAYKNPAQLRPGRVAIVGGGNSGAEIAKELCVTHEVVLAAPEVGEAPVRMDSWLGTRVFSRFLLRLVFHYLLTIRTPMGRKARPKMMHAATPLIRVKRADLTRAGAQLAERVTGVRDSRLLTQDGQALDVQNVIWCTGFDATQSFIKLPIFDDRGDPRHEAGVVTSEPGLYFVGLPFLYSMSSSMIHGVGRDAKRIAGMVEARCATLAQVGSGRLRSQDADRAVVARRQDPRWRSWRMDGAQESR
jgi:putative flavoprotein involved in K+ transport